MNVHNTKVPMEAASRMEVLVLSFCFISVISLVHLKGASYLGCAVSCLLREEVLWERTADLWTSVEMGIVCLATWALLMNPFDFLLPLSGAS